MYGTPIERSQQHQKAALLHFVFSDLSGRSQICLSLPCASNSPCLVKVALRPADTRSGQLDMPGNGTAPDSGPFCLNLYFLCLTASSATGTYHHTKPGNQAMQLQELRPLRSCPVCHECHQLDALVSVLQVATQAISTMPSLLLFPLLPFLLEVALVFWWVFVAAYLYSSGKLKQCKVTLVYRVHSLPVKDAAGYPFSTCTC